MKKNLKPIIFLSIQFLIVISICLLVLSEGKKFYTVTFDLNGGELVSGELVQSVQYGKSAVAPSAKKQGCVLSSWSAPYDNITSDITISATWVYKTTEGLTFEILGNYCVLSDCYNDLSGTVYVTASYNGYKVLGVKDNAFKDCKYIEGIYLSDGIISIGNNAFNGCSSLKTLKIPSSVENIGTSVLDGCNQLEKLLIPFVGNSIHDNTAGYFGYLFGATQYNIAYRNVPKSLIDVTITSDYEIPDYAFYKCSNIENITISGKVSRVGENAFRNCRGLKSINLPYTVTEIGKAAFVNCTSLENIKLPYMLDVLGEAVFGNCTKLESVTINNKLTEIASNAFQNCKKLTKIIINNNKNFVFENNILYILKDNEKQEYVISLEVYKDDVDDSRDFPFIEIDPGKIPFLPDIDEDAKKEETDLNDKNEK